MVKARDQLLGEDLNCHIAQRWISRKNDETEQFKSITKQEFHEGCASNTFALSWEIYDNCYGVPWEEIDPYLESGIVLLNLSRNELENAKSVYPNCRIVLVEVATELAKQRIKQRKRDQGKMLEARIKRLQEKVELPFLPDLIIKNNSSTISSILIVLIEFIKVCQY